MGLDYSVPQGMLRVAGASCDRRLAKGDNRRGGRLPQTARRATLPRGRQGNPFVSANARILAAFAAAVLAGCAAKPIAADLIISDVTVYSGEKEAPFKATVTVKDGKFQTVDRNGAAHYRAVFVVDGDGLYMTPGLWDMHAHIANEEGENVDVSAFPRFGVTSIRDVGGFREKIEASRAAITGGEVAGPNVYLAGPTLNGKAFAPFQRAVTTEAEVRHAVEELAAAGVDVIKIHRAFVPSLLPAVVEAAHQHGLRVTGHIPLGMSPLDACEAGMDGIEHVGSFLEAYVSVAPEERANSAAAIAYLESEESAPLYRCLAARGVAVTPTLVVYPAVGRSRLGDGPMPPEFIEFMRAMEHITLRLHQAGVTLLVGTDTAAGGPTAIPPGASLLDELAYLQESGIAAADILVMATSNAARSLGVGAQTGSIAVGKDADFLILGADPGADIANIRKLRAVFKGGDRVLPH